MIRQIFPFTAIVNQEKMKRALILNAINPGIGGVLIRGERGTAKSTAARALAALLPKIRVVADCPFNCDPDNPALMCDNCRARLERGEVLPVAEKPTPFVDLPVSATEDRVVGTLDIEKAIKYGERHFEPGILAAANRGLLYVDEVNLLDDHVVDLLLDAAAMGVNIVEREGISFSHPAHFILVGTMNPEEGDLRPQLLDRFGLAVDIVGVHNPEARVEIIRRRIAFEQDPQGFYEQWRPQEEELSRRIVEARRRLPMVRYTDRDLFTIAALTAEFEVDGHRADLTILKAAQAHAAFEGRLRISQRDILLAAELALPHRLKRQPFQDTSTQLMHLEQRLRHIEEQMEQSTGDGPAGDVDPSQEQVEEVPSKKV
ncbi:MAG: magnesium chelatase [Chloroflexi bacterium]|nr:magnesium chelatase [Chloroflexota bacterium]